MKIICVGRNYADHIAELKNETPADPVLFLKPDSALILKQHPFVIPEFSSEIHHEIELVIKINKVGKYIEPQFASKYYNEITVGIDFTARDLQQKLKDKGLPWEKAKAFDGSALVGNFVPVSSFESTENLTFELRKNNVSVQNGNSAMMLTKINDLIAYISTFFTLKIGDLIFTGTPAGVGKVEENDLLEGYLENQKLFRLQIK